MCWYYLACFFLWLPTLFICQLYWDSGPLTTGLALESTDNYKILWQYTAGTTVCSCLAFVPPDLLRRPYTADFGHQQALSLLVELC